MKIFTITGRTITGRALIEALKARPLVWNGHAWVAPLAPAR